MRVDRVFALLIESGLIYCCVWVCPTSGSLNACSRIHCTISDFILDFDIRRDTFPWLYRHSLCLSEYKYAYDIYKF